jgi:hypothetical protein
MNLLLPRDGSIVIIDDQYVEAKPLLDMLSSNGYPSIYFNGDVGSLPPDGTFLERVRVVFADIQLLPAMTGVDAYAQMIIQQLNRLISTTNGPYILLVWSQMEEVYADRLKELIDADDFKRKPIAFIRLNKSDYFRTINTNPVDRDLFINSFDTRFDNQDIDFILGVLEQQFPNEEKKELQPNALLKISNKIKAELRNYRAFELLIAWEGMVQNSATKFISDISSVHSIDEHWDYNFRNIISRLAESQVGRNIKDITRKDFINASFKTLNSAFSDSIDKGISETLNIGPNDYTSYKNSGYSLSHEGQLYKIVWKDFDHFELYIDDARKGDDKRSIDEILKLGNDAQKAVLKEMHKSYVGMSPELNSKLHLDFSTKNPIQPGMVYEVRVPKVRKRRFLSETYFQKSLLTRNTNGQYETNDIELRKIKFIELEVSPNCDYAQKKWLKNRVISGIMIAWDSDSFKLKNDDSFYTNFPRIKVEGQVYQVVFCFKLLKAIDPDQMLNRASRILFRIKNEPMGDIITRMTSHASRIGLIEFK